VLKEYLVKSFVTEDERLKNPDRRPDYFEEMLARISTAVDAAEINLEATHAELVEIESDIAVAKAKHNAFLKELGLSPLP
jgi:hypothetical protein